MQNIIVKDITKSHRAISTTDGQKIYELILAAFQKDDNVVLDFNKIELTITAFLNSSIGKLYASYHSEFLSEKLDIKNIKQEEVALLLLVIEKAKQRFEKSVLKTHLPTFLPIVTQ